MQFDLIRECLKFWFEIGDIIVDNPIGELVTNNNLFKTDVKTERYLSNLRILIDIVVSVSLYKSILADRNSFVVIKIII